MTVLSGSLLTLQRISGMLGGGYALWWKRRWRRKLQPVVACCGGSGGGDEQGREDLQFDDVLGDACGHPHWLGFGHAAVPLGAAVSGAGGFPIERVAEAIRPLLVAELERWIGTAVLELSRTLSPELAAAAVDAMQPDINRQLTEAWSAGFTEGMTKR